MIDEAQQESPAPMTSIPLPSWYTAGMDPYLDDILSRQARGETLSPGESTYVNQTAARLEAQGKKPHDAAATTTTPPPTSGGGGYGGPGPLAGPGPFPGGPAPVDLGGPAGIPYIPPTPQFQRPTFTGADAPPEWQAPSVEQALNEPGYKFQKQQGESGIQNWAGAKGTLYDSSTANALSDYNQNAARSDYANVWQRDFSAYGAKRQNWADTILQPTIANYGANVGATMQGYGTQAAAGQRATEFNYANAFQKWLADQNNFHWGVNWATQTA